MKVLKADEGAVGPRVSTGPVTTKDASPNHVDSETTWPALGLPSTQFQYRVLGYFDQFLQ